MTTGKVVVEKVDGKSTITRCFSKYPLKFIIPQKGDSISCDILVCDGSTAVLTTQSSTKVYKSIGSNYCEQRLEARGDALLVVIPDPVACFSTAKFSQLQIFNVVPESSFLLVDWITSGRLARGEKWDFAFYKSANHILLQGNEPLFIDTLNAQWSFSIPDRLQGYQAVAMIVLLGPKLKFIQNQIQEEVKKIMSQQLRHPTQFSGRSSGLELQNCPPKPSFLLPAVCLAQWGQELLLESRP